MQLGLDSALSSINPYTLQSTPFGVTALVDQECGGSPYTSGYSLWLTNASGLTAVPEPGSLALLAAAATIGLLIYRGRTRRRKTG